MTRIREAFVEQGGGGGIDTAKALAWGIRRLWFETDDPVATQDNLTACRARGVAVGIMRDPSWARDTIVDPAELAERMHGDLTAKGFGTTTSRDSCAAMFDDERHSPTEIAALLRRWRLLRTTRRTVWTLEAFQEGWLTDELVALVNADPNLWLAPQGYLGTPRLYPVALDEMKQRLVDRGITAAKVIAFIDGEQRIPFGWAGIIYNFLALPSAPPFPL